MNIVLFSDIDYLTFGPNTSLQVLDMGFEKQVNSILGNIRPDRQTLLLSATFGKRVEKVARSWLRSNPVR